MITEQELIACILKDVFTQPPSPCLGNVCALNESKVCTGCGRTIEQIIDAAQPTPEQRTAALKEARR